jgi:hypothetical protein
MGWGSISLRWSGFGSSGEVSVGWLCVEVVIVIGWPTSAEGTVIKLQQQTAVGQSIMRKVIQRQQNETCVRGFPHSRTFYELRVALHCRIAVIDGASRQAL